LIFNQDVIALSLDFKKMIEILMEKKPEISLDQIRELIDIKKRKIGAGYLTDQGALFLVGSDLGISFESASRTQLGIQDLYIGARDVNLVGRILSIYPKRVFTKKETGQEITNRTMTIFDESGSIRIKIWENLIPEIDKLELKPGSLIKITNGYVKAGLNGKLLLNLGENSMIELTEDTTRIPNISSMELDVNDIINEKDGIVISGYVKDNPRIIEFSDVKGDVRKSLQMTISNEEGVRKLRVVIWNINESDIPKIIRRNSKVRIVGARIKNGNIQYGNGDFEIHGDEGSLIEVIGSENEYELLILRLMSSPKMQSDGKISVVAVDNQRNLIFVSADRIPNFEDAKINSVLECIPTRLFGNKVVLRDDSYVKIRDDTTDIPTSEESITKINNVTAVGTNYAIEAIILQQPNLVDVTTRNGEIVAVSDTILGDDTGEIKLVGWREGASEIGKLNVGDRVRILGAILNSGREGKIELSITRDTIIEKL
jgi:replication factor A1